MKCWNAVKLTISKQYGIRSPVTGDRALTEEKFKAADRKFDLYISKVEKDVKIN